MNAQDPIENLTADQRQLYELMSEISEDCYCAGWMVGNEYTLWSAIQTGEMRYGMSDIDRDLLAQVAALSVKTGCWIVWRDYKDGLPRNDSSTWGPYAIPLAEWGAIYDAKNVITERATQPAQRQSQIDIHRITGEEARKIGGGLIDKIPADDVTALGRAIYQRILDSQPAQKRCCDHDSDCAVHNAPAYPVGPCDCTLSEKPTQDQVAAVRAVPDTDPVVDRWALEKAVCAGELDRDHCVYKRRDVVEIIKVLNKRATDAEAKLAAIRAQEPVEFPMDERNDDPAEAAFWRFDARHKGYGRWKQAPQSERDAFKAEYRAALAHHTTPPSQGDTNGLPG